MKYSTMILGVLLAGFSTPGDAARAWVTGQVTRTLVADNDRWGGCTARLNVLLSDRGPDCRGQWVSFSCSGDFTTKDIAYRMFDSAQMAYSLGHRVFVDVDDAKKHNGYCYANRIDVQKR